MVSGLAWLNPGLPLLPFWDFPNAIAYSNERVVEAISGFLEAPGRSGRNLIAAQTPPRHWLRLVHRNSGFSDWESYGEFFSGRWWPEANAAEKAAGIALYGVSLAALSGAIVLGGRLLGVAGMAEKTLVSALNVSAVAHAVGLIASSTSEQASRAERAATIPPDPRFAPLIELAQQGSRRWKQDFRDPFNYHLFFRELENIAETIPGMENFRGVPPLHLESRSDELAQSWQSFIDSSRTSVSAQPDGVSQTFRLMEELFLRTDISQYFESRYSHQAMLMGEGGNCVARARLILSAAYDLGIQLPEGKYFAVQIYKNHPQILIFDPAQHLGFDLMSGRTVDFLAAPLWHPAIFLYAFLQGRGQLAPVSLQDLLLAPAEPLPHDAAFPPGLSRVDGQWTFDTGNLGVSAPSGNREHHYHPSLAQDPLFPLPDFPVSYGPIDVPPRAVSPMPTYFNGEAAAPKSDNVRVLEDLPSDLQRRIEHYISLTPLGLLRNFSIVPIRGDQLDINGDKILIFRRRADADLYQSLWEQDREAFLTHLVIRPLQQWLQQDRRPFSEILRLSSEPQELLSSDQATVSQTLEFNMLIHEIGNDAADLKAQISAQASLNEMIGPFYPEIGAMFAAHNNFHRWDSGKPIEILRRFEAAQEHNARILINTRLFNLDQLEYLVAAPIQEHVELENVTPYRPRNYLEFEAVPLDPRGLVQPELPAPSQQRDHDISAETFIRLYLHYVTGRFANTQSSRDQVRQQLRPLLQRWTPELSQSFRRLNRDGRFNAEYGLFKSLYLDSGLPWRDDIPQAFLGLESPPQ